MFLRRTTWIAFSVATLAMACGNKNSAPPAPPPIKVVVQAVKDTQASYFDEYPATVTALNQVDLRPQVSGFITGIHFRDGDRVKKGQLLYSIDNQLYNANYQQAVAGLSVQEANLAKAQKDADRYHQLEKQDAVARQLVDNADAALEVARRQAEAAKANIQGVQTNVRYTKVYAPFDGVIGISMVKPGTAVVAGQTVLNTVSSDKELAVDFNIDQREIFRVNTLLKQKPVKNDSTFTLAFNGDVYPNPGTIAFVDRAVDPQTGTIKVRLVFPNAERTLVSGMNGTVRVRNSEKNAILVPYKAVTEQLGEYYVYVPADSSKVSQRKIVLGKQVGNDVMIKEGLKPGDSVVIEGVQNLKEGVKVHSVPK